MNIISHHISLNLNFTPPLFEHILTEFTEECANRLYGELSQRVIELISLGLPDEDDKKELMSLFSKIIRETGQINSTDSDAFYVRVVLNEEFKITLKFEKNYAPFMEGAWQRV